MTHLTTTLTRTSLALLIASVGCAATDPGPSGADRGQSGKTSQALAGGLPIPTEMIPNDPDGPWRSALIDFIGSFDVSDFTLLGGAPVPFDDTGTLYGTSQGQYQSLGSIEVFDIERAWLMEKATPPMPGALLIPDECFTLGYMQGDPAAGGPQHGIDVTKQWVEPVSHMSTVGYGLIYTYDSPINPYFGLPELRNRAAVVVAQQLLKLDTIHKTRNNGNSLNYPRASHELNANWTTYSIADSYTPADPSDDWIPGYLGDQPPKVRAALGNNLNRIDQLVQPLEDVAVEYMLIRDSLSDAEKQSFDHAFIRLGNRMALWGYSYQQMNRVTPAPNALLIIARLTGDPQLLSDYLTYADQLYNPANNRFNAAGFFADDGGWDGSYNGYNLIHAGRLLRLEQYLANLTGGATTQAYPTIEAALEDMFALRAHLQLIDPGTSVGLPFSFQYSPNHFNSRTSGDASWGQGGRRIMAYDAMASGITDAIPFLRGWDPVDPFQLNVSGGDARAKALDLAKHTGASQTDAGLASASTSPWAPLSSLTCSSGAPVCGASDGCCPTGCSASTDNDCYQGVDTWQLESKNYYRPSTEVITHQYGIFNNWAANISADPNLELYPIERPGDSIQVFGDEFGYAKFGDYAVMIHTGHVGSYEAGLPRFACAPSPLNPNCTCNANSVCTEPAWDVGNLPAGYGGGMLSYFWTPDSGGAIVGRRKSRYDTGADIEESKAQMDDWSQEPAWPLHRVIVTTPDGDTTTSARILSPTRSIAPVYDALGDPQALDVVIKGSIPVGNRRYGDGTNNSPGPNVLDQPISYSRLFTADASGLKVQSNVGPSLSATDTFSSVVETIPLQHYSCRRQGAFSSNLPAIETWLFVQGNPTPIAGHNLPPGQWQNNVERVEHVRFGHSTEIVFDVPRRVSMSEHWYDWYSYVSGQPDCQGSQSWMHTQNIIVDLLGNAGGQAQPLTATQIFSYLIRPN